VRHAAEIADLSIAADAADSLSAESVPGPSPTIQASVAALTEEQAWASHEDLMAIAREVSQRTGAPLLAPPTVRAILEALSADLMHRGFDPAETAQRVRAACRQRTPTIEVSQRDVVFMLRGLQLNGHAFGRGHDDARTLALRLCNQVLFLCQREEMLIDDAIRAQIRRWIGGDLLA